MTPRSIGVILVLMALGGAGAYAASRLVGAPAPEPVPPIRVLPEREPGSTTERGRRTPRPDRDAQPRTAPGTPTRRPIPASPLRPTATPSASPAPRPASPGDGGGDDDASDDDGDD